jgi:hypothetical protein
MNQRMINLVSKKYARIPMIDALIKRVSVTYFLFFVNLLLVGVNYGQRTMQVCS